MISGYLWVVVIGLYMGASWLANMWAHSETSRGVQFLGLGVYTVAIGFVFLPLLFIAKEYYPSAIPTAGILTLMVAGGLTGAVFVTRKDFSFLGPILFVGMLLAFGFIVPGVLFKFCLGLVFCFSMLALFAAYILTLT